MIDSLYVKPRIRDFLVRNQAYQFLSAKNQSNLSYNIPHNSNNLSQEVSKLTVTYSM